jgi:hypothetical protein
MSPRPKARYSSLTSAQHVTSKPSAKQVNIRRCPVCGAKPGESCFVLTATRFIELNETHRPQRGKLPKEQATSQSPRKLSTPELDRRHQEKLARQKAGESTRNGGRPGPKS